ncbi:MAG: short-chain dehydrogenase [Lysobacteraceae bacterium]|nr:MAG: short-chain dehydrogenase [Xanthomonadaceae bacterium]
MTIAGKSILITGASRGIGEATARYFASQGANTVMLARSAKALEKIEADITSAGGKALALVSDVANYEAMENAVQACVDTFGGLDILVNNAALIEPIAHLADSDPEAWGHVVDVNVKGVYHGMRAAIPAMLAGSGGSIINISSGAATSALEGWSHYCCTKAAVLSLTQCGHTEYCDRGIRVVGLSPGTVATEMQTVIRQSGINPVSQLDPSVHIPPQWVAKAIAFLCGEGGAPYAGTDFSLKSEKSRQLIGLVS